jgi:cellobiose-specific phosphotransferase system component IIA
VIEVEESPTNAPASAKAARVLGGTMAEGGSLSADETSLCAAAGSTKESRSAQSTSPCPAAGSRNASRRTQTKTAPTKKTLVQRVYNTIDGELTKLEKQKGLTSQDRERASRALSQMVNALEKAVEMQREMTKTKTSGGGAKSRESLAHAEDLRREIAERLERLNRKRAAPRSSE